MTAPSDNSLVVPTVGQGDTPSPPAAPAVPERKRRAGRKAAAAPVAEPTVPAAAPVSPAAEPPASAVEAPAPVAEAGQDITPDAEAATEPPAQEFAAPVPPAPANSADAELLPAPGFGSGLYRCVAECQGKILYRVGQEYRFDKNPAPRNFVWIGD